MAQRKNRLCKECGRRFLVSHKRVFYCSPECQSAHERKERNIRYMRYYWRDHPKIRKRCECCGDVYYTTKTHQKYCSKECARKIINKKSRDSQRKHNIGDITRDGMRLYKYLHKGRCIYWTGQMLSDLRRLYPANINAEVAEILGVGVRAMQRKAKELGIKKDKRWLKDKQRETARINGFRRRLYGKRADNRQSNTIH